MSRASFPPVRGVWCLVYMSICSNSDDRLRAASDNRHSLIFAGSMLFTCALRLIDFGFLKPPLSPPAFKMGSLLVGSIFGLYF